MPDISIRPLNFKKDATSLVEIFYDIWFFDAKSPTVGKMCALNFLLHYVIEASMNAVAVDNATGEVLGIVSVDEKDKERELKGFKRRAIIALEKINYAALCIYPNARDTRLFNDIFLVNYQKMRRMMADELKALPEMLLLIVSKKAKGKGVGKALTEHAKEHMKRGGAKEYYLLTDSSCDYSFYDKGGMERVLDVKLSFSINHVRDYQHYLNTTLGCFIYKQAL